MYDAIGKAEAVHLSGWQLRQARRRMIRDSGGDLRCWRCQMWIDVSLSGLHPDGLTVGHILPIAVGGTNEYTNLAPEHRRCNLAAGARVAPPSATIAVPR